ncbi:MAG: GntR family transcriptional regulator [Gammaproteobacteria bacterium]|nr:GntR family transcriptional regulator [Gammaproteobacteria bacterium]MBT6480538.1 GntR family transcriptional regulator [Gammaproteobacteria bacterium]MDB3909503.1 GntR family transcriptional regulator [Gammaproteobacteria bacterium]MDC0413527.1 GntR family transcriptional regulator [Gammaproteobacteria bacterium]
MEINWNNKEPIYLQLRDRLVELIMDGVLLEGDALPSVRQISSEQRINPITVSKAFQILVDEELVEKKRGLGMYVLSGAKEKLSTEEKRKFLEQEWPQIAERIERLGLEVDELLGSEKNG